MKTIKYFFLAMLVFASANCSIAKTSEANAPQANESASIPEVPVAPVAEQNSSTANAPREQQTANSPDALVRDLYRVHEQEFKANKFQILNGKSRTALDKYFDKNLADLIWKDLTTHQGEVGVIDFDLFYNAQDADIKNLTVGQPKIENGKASVQVSFANFGKKERLVYSLVEQNGAWKIADIKYMDGGGLLQYFREDAKNNKAANAGGAEGNFEGTYQVGNTTCTVKPIKMAFELKWAKGSGTMNFFFAGDENLYKYTSEDKGKGVDAFVFDDAGLARGKFFRADGEMMPVKKIK